MPRQKVRRPWVDYLVYLVVRSLVAFAQMLSIEQSYALAHAFWAGCSTKPTNGTEKSGSTT